MISPDPYLGLIGVHYDIPELVRGRAMTTDEMLASAPLDDEPDDDDFDGGLTKARGEASTGQTISHEELLHRLGIDE
jgi:hypothetical protein